MANEAPQCNCRCCAKPMHAEWQPGYVGKEGIWMVTCRNTGCDLRSYTFSEKRYSTMDLSNYLPCKASGIHG